MSQDNSSERPEKNTTRQFIANSKRPKELLQNNSLANTKNRRTTIRQFTSEMLKKQKKYHKTIY